MSKSQKASDFFQIKNALQKTNACVSHRAKKLRKCITIRNTIAIRALFDFETDFI